jgi:hypothetical protein
MPDLDVTCPVGYGAIRFVGGGTGRYCPVSGEQKCIECHVTPFNPDSRYKVHARVEKDKVK